MGESGARLHVLNSSITLSAEKGYTFRLPPCTYTSAILVVHALVRDCRAGALEWYSYDFYVALATFVLEILSWCIGAGVQISVMGYVKREYKYVEKCHGICVQLQWMVVGVFLAEMFKELQETLSMAAWLYVAEEIKYPSANAETPPPAAPSDDDSSADSSLGPQLSDDKAAGADVLLKPVKLWGVFVVACKLLVALWVGIVGIGFILRCLVAQWCPFSPFFGVQGFPSN